MTFNPLLAIKDLSVRFSTPKGIFQALRGIDLAIQRKEILALVGESGSGKTVTAMSIPRLLPNNALPPEGSVTFDGNNLLALPESEIQKIRGKRISVIFQDPANSLNPLHTISRQIAEVIMRHQLLGRKEAMSRVVNLLDIVGLPEAKSRLDAYPHTFSGGQRQRIMMAMALANNPDLLIADEPTTALDVTIQAQILDLLRDIQARTQMSILFITHDLNIVSRIADRVAVMKDGEIVEAGSTEEIVNSSRHPYTRRLIQANYARILPPPDLDAPAIMACENLTVEFPVKKGLLKKTTGYIHAVKDSTIVIRQGQTTGVVGESGSGKTTLGMALLRMEKSSGRILFMGKELQNLKPKAVRQMRRDMQIVFQDSSGALNPTMTVEEIISEGLRIYYPELQAKEHFDLIRMAMCGVGLDAQLLDRLPHELSGGQRQRVALARALALKPGLIILDEPTSSLDRLVQMQLVELLRDLQEAYGIAYLLISHDMTIVGALSHYVYVMHRGHIAEHGPAKQIFEEPKNSCTQSLINAICDIPMATI